MKQLFATLLACFSMVQAQTPLFYEGFEDVPTAAPLTVPSWSATRWAAMDDGFAGISPRSGGKFGYSPVSVRAS